MSLLVYIGVLVLVLAIVLVGIAAQGIHARLAAPAQLRSAWVLFGFECFLPAVTWPVTTSAPVIVSPSLLTALFGTA